MITDITPLLGRIHQGDCLEFMRQLPDKCIDFSFADPPYGIMKAEWDSKYPTGFEKELLRISKGVVITCGEKNIAECILSMGEDYKSPIYGWNKNGMSRGPIGYMNVIIGIVGGKVKLGQNFVGFTIQDLTRKEHPSPKPIEYILGVVSRFTDENQIVFDPFMGSGTTAVACERLGRMWFGCELEPKYCEIATKRIEAERNQLKLF